VSGTDLRVRLGAIELEHPLVNASGTYDALAVAGPSSLADFPYAAYFPKTVTLEPRAGNRPPRVTETPSGMINAIGLANPGIDTFLDQLPRLAGLTVPVIVSVGGSRPEDYLTVIERTERRLEASSAAPAVAGYELNVSCPNVAQGGLAIGADADATGRLTAAARRLTGRTLIVKLTPNVTDVVAPARAAAEGGADALALVNTFKAMVLNPQTLRPLLGNRTGGLCGPAIRPIALRMVAEVAAAVDLPIVGMGGVTSGQDALDFIACGATAVAIGAAVFADPQAPHRIVAELRELLERRGADSLAVVRAVALEDS
jgi:dihydroorotate dehydrogenase (NAD+) catalytic subunit